MTDSPIPQAILDAAGIAGTWIYDHRTDRLSLSGTLPKLLGLDPRTAAVGISIESFLERTHPEDRARVESYLFAAVSGGPLEVEFRTCESPGGIHHLLIRGRISSQDEVQAVRSCGIAIDRTEELARILMHPELTMNRMAEHVIAMRLLALTLQLPFLVERIEQVMIEIGFELARFLPEPESEDEPRH